MKILAALFAALVITLSGGLAQAKPDTVELYTEAVMIGDVPALETLLAPNYWHINANGHIEDKEHFINTIKNKELVVDRLTFTNARTAMIGDSKLITGTGYLKAKATPPLPQGLMRVTVVVVSNKGRDQVVLFQATPVVATDDCNDGNCKIQ
ncbi:nuclear transport factor 2 family protein [Desulfovibrio sp.]|uniref:nuclear transport factor 2 family protein n=1 Tax=Desulfovibrio sp. TaxID=885 RepID=UPI0035B4C173